MSTHAQQFLRGESECVLYRLRVYMCDPCTHCCSSAAPLIATSYGTYSFS